MAEIESNLKIEKVPVEQIHGYKKNIKIHNEDQISEIAQSIQKFGFNNPILVNENGEIIAGHGRYAAARLLELDTVPVIKLVHLDDTQVRLYRIADNKLSEKGKWDLDMLKIEIGELEARTDISDNLEITDSGFDVLEIDSLFVEKTAKEKSDIKSNIIPYVPDDEIVTKFGDVWQIGKHRIICGDSLKEETYEKLMGKTLADQVLFDAPYNVSAKSIGNSGRTKHADFVMAAGEMSDVEFTEFLKTVMQRCSEHSKTNALQYLWMDWRHSAQILAAGHSVYPLFINLCVWVKTSGGMGKLYRSQHELCFVFGKDKHYLDNVELGKNGRYRTNVWHYAGVNSFGPHKCDQKMHPTVKPMEMFRDIILDSTPRGGVVLDAFSGSGTTIIAAEKCHRIGYAVEYEPKYVDTLLRRYKELFGVDAVLEENGKSYSELLEEQKRARN